MIGEDILLDTFGDPDVFLRNMRAFGIDARLIKHVIISHDHWDHIAGLWYILHNRTDIAVYVCPGFKAETKERIRSYGVRVIEAAGLTCVKDGVYSTGEICGEYAGAVLYEQALAIKTENGMTVVCGCAHPGVAKMVKSAHKNLGLTPYLATGGFHLKNAPEGEIRDTILLLKGMGLKKAAPTHCTGCLATRMFRKSFKDGFIAIKEGDSIEV